MNKNSFYKILLLVCTLLFCVVLIEILLRIYNPFGFRLKCNTILLPTHKNYLFTNNDCDKLDDPIRHTKNSLGFRGTELPSNFANMLSIITVGGSTTECLLLSDNHDWPHLVGEKLKKDFQNIWINNAGLDGHSTYGHYLLMQNVITHMHPKVVLFLVGINDTEPFSAYFHDQSLLKQATGPLLIASLLTNCGKNLLQGHFSGAFKTCQLLLATSAEFSELASCIINLYRYAQARNMGVQHRCIDFASSPHRKISQNELETTLRSIHNEVVPNYQQRLLRLISYTKQANILPVFITQPALYGTSFDVDTGVDMNQIVVLRNTGWTQWAILEIINDVTREVCNAQKIPLIDLAHILPKRSRYFYDFLHFTNEGSEAVADIIATELQPFLSTAFPDFTQDRHPSLETTRSKEVPAG